MDFVADVPVDGHRHEDDLGVQACPENAAELAGCGGERGGHVREVDHFMLRWLGTHLGIFCEAKRGGCEGASKWPSSGARECQTKEASAGACGAAKK